jgi:uncharacterized protein (DUF608 family)
MERSIFPTNLPDREWSQFRADGFDTPVCGVIHHGTNPPDCGMPLGGIDTGCVDLEPSGLLGFNSIFNSLVEPTGPLNVPLLGLSLNLQTWVLTTLNMMGRDGYIWLDHPRQYNYRGVRTASQIHYWGHYPVADLEFDTDAPVAVGLRAWAPFIPGEAATSNIPGAVFEVRLRNATGEKQAGTLAFSFPGPTESEALTTRFDRATVDRACSGVAVMSEKVSYALAVIERQPVRTGGALGVDGKAWAKIEKVLPSAREQAGASLAVDFALAPGEEKAIRLVLAWYCPQWRGGGTNSAGGNVYTHMYASRFHSVVDVAQFLAYNHESLLTRILAWQQVLYADTALPGWLQDSLINVLHLLTETTVWAQAKPPIGDWCREEDGLFAMNESPRWCPQMECIPCGFYGNQPVVYFFPELALSTMRGYTAYQYPNGAVPWVFGGCTGGTPPYEVALPSPGYSHKPMTTLDGPCYAEMVDRLWRRTGDDGLLREFYEAAKKNTTLTMNLRPGSGAAGIVSMPTDNLAQDWMESTELLGIVPHIGGIHLAQLRTVRRMAEAMGDEAFAQQCREWLEQGSAVMEEHTWTGSHYMLFNELETGKCSDVVMSCMLDGEWMCLFQGLPGVFAPDRVDATLETIKKTSVALTDFGAVIFCKPTASALGEGDWSPGYMGSHGVHPTGTFILAMLYMYRGQRELGLELARRPVQEVVRRGWIYDWPVILDGEIDGKVEPRIGFDYYQNLMLWSLPAALAGGDFAGPCAPGGLVSRILDAAAEG